MTDEDKTLLEMAAKAAGIKYDQEASKPNPVSGVWFGPWLTYDHEPTEYDRRRWNALCNDGDALRLAVKLRITVEQELLEVKACAYVLIGTERKYFTSVSGNVSREEATRLAIVRAAAEIGKAMK